MKTNSNLTTKEAYKLRADCFRRKYELIVEEFNQHNDDRKIVANMYRIEMDAMKAMEDVENNYICVAFNKQRRQDEVETDEIIRRFTGLVYTDKCKWEPAES